MSFKMVFRSLQEVFPQVDLRILKAVAVEHSKDVDAAVEFVLYEVLPSLNEPAEASYSIDDTHGRKNSPAEVGVHDCFWGNQGAENTDLLPRSSVECGSDPFTNHSDAHVNKQLVSNGDLEEQLASIECISRLFQSSERNGYDDLHINVQGTYRTEATMNDTAVCTPAQNFPASEKNTDFFIECKEPVSRGLSRRGDIHAFSDLEIKNSLPDAITTAQGMPSFASEDTLNLEHGTLLEKVNHNSLSGFKEQYSRGISENCSKSVALETDKSSVAEKPTLVGIQSGHVFRTDVLEEFLSDFERNKEILVFSFESVNNMMKDVELHEDRARKAREEASKASHEILTKAEDMKEMLRHAEEAKNMQAAEVYGRKSILAAEARELQSRLLNLSDQREKSLSIIEEIHQILETRLAAAKEEMAAAEQEKLDKEEEEQKFLNEQEVIMEEIAQDSKRLQQESEEIAKMREFVMDHGRTVDVLQGEMEAICKDVMVLKERVDGSVPLSRSLLLTSSSLSSSSSSSSSHRSLSEKYLHTVELAESPEKTTGESPRNKKTESYSNDNGEISGNRPFSDDDWELFE